MMLLIMMAFVAASRRYAQDFLPLLMTLVFLGFALRWERGLNWKRWHVAAWAVFVWSALININVPFYQSFYTPTPDLNVIRVFVAMKPTLDKIAPGPQLDEHAAIAANDLGSALLNEASGWLIRYWHRSFAWLKITMFLLFQLALFGIIVILLLALFKGWRNAYNDK